MNKTLEAMERLVIRSETHPRVVESKKTSKERIEEKIVALHKDLSEFTKLARISFPNGHIQLSHVDWNHSELPPDVIALFASEYAFQSADIQMQISLTEQDKHNQGIKIQLLRMGSEWSSVNLNTWTENSRGINVGVNGNETVGRVHEALEAQHRFERIVSPMDEREKYAIRVDIGKQILNFAVTQAIQEIQAHG